AVSLSAADYTITLSRATTSFDKLAPPPPPTGFGPAANSSYAFIPIFARVDPLSPFLPGNLDPYLNYFAGLNSTNSPGFQIGTTTIAAPAPLPLAHPYYYSYPTRTTSTGWRLIEFFSFDSEPADPNLLRNPSFEFTGNTTKDSPVIQGVSTSFITSMLGGGMEVSGPGIPAGSTIIQMDAAGG